MKLAKVSAKGQVTIPVGIRRRLRLKEGDKLLFIERYREVVIDNASSFQAQDALAGASRDSRDLRDVLSDKKLRDLFDNLCLLSDEEMQNLLDRLCSLSNDKLEDFKKKVLDLYSKLLLLSLENFTKKSPNLLSELRNEDF